MTDLMMQIIVRFERLAEAFRSPLYPAFAMTFIAGFALGLIVLAMSVRPC